MRATFGPVYVGAGPQASLLLGGRQMGTLQTDWYTTSPNQTYEIDQAASEDHRRFDAGACVGLGMQLPAGLGANVRLYQGLVVLNDQRGSAEGNYRRQSLQAALTYTLTR